VGLNPPSARLDIRRLLASFAYAWQGIRYTARSQPNWRIHLLAAVGAIVLALLLGVQPIELAVLALTIGMVLGLECLNTALEAAIDALGGQPSLAAKHAKDAAAAGVLVGAITAVVVAAVIFVPRLLALTR
jgi:diacylglycerol kinase (ATP)